MSEIVYTVYLNGTKFTRHTNAKLDPFYHPMVLAVQGLPTIETIQYEHRYHLCVSRLVAKK